MNISEWFSSFFKNDEEDEVPLKCPKCGSENLSRFKSLINFVQVVNGSEEPIYKEYTICSDCGYRLEDE